jgi:hypothetical protein
MSEYNQRWWEMARQARAQLETLAMRNPHVQMISIGLDPQGRSHEPVLIVSLHHGAAVPPELPEAIDGIPVRVVYADYQLEQGEQYDIREENQTEGQRPQAVDPRTSGGGAAGGSGSGEAA